MTRRLLDILGALSLLLVMAIVVLWVRSYLVGDIVEFGVVGGNCHIVQSIFGRLHLLSRLDGGYTVTGVQHTADRLVPQTQWQGGMSGYPPRVNWCCGFVCQTYSKQHMSGNVGDRPPVTHHRLIVVPYWLPAALFAIPPAVWLIALRRRWRRRYRLAHGLCLTCGYNLTGNVTGRCPECGAPVPRTVDATEVKTPVPIPGAK